MDVGAELRDARERRKFSIEDLSHRTKITSKILRAIDNNDAAHLPGGIFTRAFVKTYAREVGLDPIDIVRRYELQFEPPEPLVAAPLPEGDHVARKQTDSNDADKAPWRFDLRLQMIAAAVILAAVSYIAFNRSHYAPPRVPSGAAATAGVVRPSSSAMLPQPTGTSGTIGRAPAVTNARGLRAELHVRTTCWITATADGKRVAFRLLNGGERLTLDASNELVLRAGDAASLDYSVNGSRGRTLGGRGEAVTIRLTPTNYREFVAR